MALSLFVINKSNFVIPFIKKLKGYKDFDKIKFLIIFFLSMKGNMQDESINDKETNQPKEADFPKQNVPEVCFLL